MTDLILHIGLGKCGSTTLQRSVFQDEHGYLGRTPGMPPEDNFADGLLEAGPFRGRQTTNHHALARWVDLVKEAQAERWPEAERLILSHETLSAASRMDDRPVLKILSTLKEELWPEGQIKVVLILRNQAARLASSYAQSSATMWHPGQADFERYLERHLSSRRHVRLLDYQAWLDGLGEILGADNVCTLLLEDSQTPEFWQSLSDFCQLENFQPESMLDRRSSTHNVRSRGAKSWTLQPLDIDSMARNNVEKWFNLFWPSGHFRQTRKSLMSRVTRMAKKACETKLSRHDTQRRETEIHLSHSAMQAVRTRCGAANEKLALQLGRDLSSLNY